MDYPKARQNTRAGKETRARKDPKARKKRVRTGCLTCRGRRIKCDERKPQCGNCENSRCVCEGWLVSSLSENLGLLDKGYPSLLRWKEMKKYETSIPAASAFVDTQLRSTSRPDNYITEASRFTNNTVDSQALPEGFRKHGWSELTHHQIEGGTKGEPVDDSLLCSCMATSMECVGKTESEVEIRPPPYLPPASDRCIWCGQNWISKDLNSGLCLICNYDKESE